MMASIEKLCRAKEKAAKDGNAQKFYAEALDGVVGILEHFPSEVWCTVGKTVSDEGAYQMILREEMEGWYEPARKVFTNKSQSTKNVATLPEEI